VDEVTVVLAAAERDPARPMLGVNVRDAFDSSYPGEVSIDSGTVGGPSAGLAFAMGIIDLLSEGDLTGGEKVAATGTITTDGRVGPVGGIEQKAAAVRRAGSTLFLVPDSLSDDELDAARRMAEGVQIVPVGTLQEALDALAARGGAEVAMWSARH
jgi:Lon-like protease